MQTTRKNLRRNHLQDEEVVSKKSKLDFIKAFLFIVSFLGLLLALLGYGYMLGIGFTFGYDPLAVVWLLAYVFVRFIRSDPKRHRATRQWLQGADESVSYMEKAVFIDSPFKGFIRVLITTPLYIYIGTFVMFLIAFLLLTAIVTVPNLGYQEGQKIAQDVKNATGCVPHDIENAERKVIKKDDKVKPRANCVRVLQEGKKAVRGRVIATNSQRIFLYVRETQQDNKVIRVTKSYPIRNTVVERVDTEDIPLTKVTSVTE